MTASTPQPANPANPDPAGSTPPEAQPQAPAAPQQQAPVQQDQAALFAEFQAFLAARQATAQPTPAAQAAPPAQPAPAPAPATQAQAPATQPQLVQGVTVQTPQGMMFVPIGDAPQQPPAPQPVPPAWGQQPQAQPAPQREPGLLDAIKHRDTSRETFHRLVDAIDEQVFDVHSDNYHSDRGDGAVMALKAYVSQFGLNSAPNRAPVQKKGGKLARGWTKLTGDKRNPPK